MVMWQATGESMPPESSASTSELVPTGSPPGPRKVSRKISAICSRTSIPIVSSGSSRSILIRSPKMSCRRDAISISICCETIGKDLSLRRARVRKRTTDAVSSLFSIAARALAAAVSNRTSGFGSHSATGENDSSPKARDSTSFTCSSSVSVNSAFLSLRRKILPRIRCSVMSLIPSYSASVRIFVISLFSNMDRLCPLVAIS